MQVQKLSIGGVALITPRRVNDDLGTFAEVHNRSAWRKFGIDADFVQDNHAIIANKGSVRGLHFQAPPVSQGKLVRVTKGSIFDVAVDIRHGSPTFGQHLSVLLSAQNWFQLWIPAGFAHGFCSLEDNTEVLTKVTGHYSPVSCHGIRWDDPALAISWPVTAGAAIITGKDSRFPSISELAVHFPFGEKLTATVG